MSALTPEVVADGLRFLRGAYGPTRVEASREAAQAWLQLCGSGPMGAGLSVAEFQDALRRFTLSSAEFPPTAGQIVEVARGRWTRKTIPRADAYGTPSPRELGHETLTVLVDPLTGASIRAFNRYGCQVDPDTGCWIREPAHVAPALLPPPSHLAGQREPEMGEAVERLGLGLEGSECAE